jgi:1,2-dihydroxy-3-keto-5-methylthiopentene dioxygenase
MAVLHLENGASYTEISVINRQLSVLNVWIESLPLQRYPVDREARESLQDLLSQEILALDQRQKVLQAFQPKSAKSLFFPLEKGCVSCELISVNPSSPHLYQLLASGSRPHRHEDDEIMYLLSGECIFGFSHPTGYRVEVLLQAQEYIMVPAGIRHWFGLSARLHAKAIRYSTKRCAS